MRSYSCMAEGILPWARYFSAARMAFALSNPIGKFYPPEGSVNEYRREANRQRQGACGPAERRGRLDLPLWLFSAWTAASCFLSAEPRLSTRKLVNVSTFLLFYLAQSFLTRRIAVLLACVLIVSASAGALWGAGELVVGRGVVVSALSADSPLRAQTPLGEGDAGWRVGGRRVSTVAAIDDPIRRRGGGGGGV